MTTLAIRSPYVEIDGIVHFPRMLDKIRLHIAGDLPDDYVAKLGTGFDGRCVRFLQVDYSALVRQIEDGGSDADILAWCYTSGRKPNDEEIEIWSGFMRKFAWRDSFSQTFKKRVADAGFGDNAEILTMFDLIHAEEGHAARA